MEIILFDRNSSLVQEWKKSFAGIDTVKTCCCDVKDIHATYLVTAGNSYGWMTGGIDLAVRDLFGVEVQDAIQLNIIYCHNGCLPVGEIIDVPTHHEQIPYLLYVPTMRMPRLIEPEDVFYVATKIFKAVKGLQTTVAICGLGTGTGGIKDEICAKEMRRAYDYIFDSNNDTSELAEH